MTVVKLLEFDIQEWKVSSNGTTNIFQICSLWFYMPHWP